PQQSQCRLDVSHERVLQPVDDRVKSGIENDLPELWKAIQVCAVDRVDLGLRLLDGRSPIEPREISPVIVVMSSLFCRRQGEGRPYQHIISNEGEFLRHHSDDGVWTSVDA